MRHTRVEALRPLNAACWFPAAALAVLAGCTQILGIEELSGDGERIDAGGQDAAITDAAPPDGRMVPACADSEIETPLGAIDIDTEPAGNDMAATCGGDSSPELLLAWTAPVTDYYVFDTFGMGFDTVLALYAPECDGTELACSNNVGPMVQSELVRKFRQGEQALVLVDGNAGDSGQGPLQIQRVDCPDADLEGQSFPLTLSTVGFGDDASNACGGQDQEDRAYHWVPPADGLYYVRVTSESFTPVVSLIDGPRCDDRLLGCNAGASGEHGAEVVRFLRAGQPVSIVVDGLNGAGEFTLDIGISEGPTCPEATLDEGDIFQDQLTQRSLAPSCGYARQSGMFGGSFDLDDKTYLLTAPSIPGDCFGSCDVWVNSPDPVVLYALEGGDCGGPELACVESIDADGDGFFEANVVLPRDDQERLYTVVVATRSPASVGDYQIEVFCFLACP